MRASVIVALLVGGAVASAEPPDPTVVQPAPDKAPPKVVPDPCDLDSRCRLERFRAELAHRRRLEYLARLADAARSMEQRVQRAKPFRTRYPFDVDYLFASNVSTFAALISYAPAFWLRLEGYAGYFTTSNDDYKAGGQFQWSGFSGGLQARFLPIKWLLTPYTAIGWGYLSGSSNYYNYLQGGNGNGSSEAHLFTLGLGAELVVPYFHFALGYQFEEPLYAQGRVGDRHDLGMKTALQSATDNHRHGAVVEIGVAF
jgi:hypothetical protein